MDVTDIATDLIAEQDALDALCAELTESDWQKPTASPGWTVADQTGHLAYFDDAAAVAIGDEVGFAALKSELLEQLGSGSDPDAFTLGRYRAMTGAELLHAWRQDRQRLAQASATLTNDRRVEWFGPSMGSKSFLTARLMEAWAHGQDIADTVGRVRQPTDRLRHIAQLGFITRGWTYINRRLDVPTSELRVSLTAPSGAHWDFGPEGATQQVEGSAEDFCLVVTQRRHLDDTNLDVTGSDAREWLLMAQAFAGGATDGPSAARGVE